MDRRTDEQLVAAHVGGDREALGGIYDRHADELYDTASAMLGDGHEAADAVQEVFLIAVERLGDLRDPSRLRAWLFAILRNEVYRRTRLRHRSRPTDFSAPGSITVVAPADPRGEAAAVATAELAASVRAAAGGLDQGDQMVLELSARRGLAGADLAAALGVTPDQSYVLVHRMRSRVARSLDALAVARGGRKDCPELDHILAGWDGELTVLIRKRVARHVDGCGTCGETKRRFAALTLFSLAPIVAAPPALRALVLERAGGATAGTAAGVPYEFTADGGFPLAVRAPRSAVLLPALVAVVAVLVLVVGGVVVLSRGGSQEPAGLATEPIAAAPPTGSAPARAAPEPTATTPSSSSTAPTTTVPATAPTTTVVVVSTTSPTTNPPTTTSPPPAPGQIVLSSGIVDLGADAPSAALTVENTGGTTVSWAIDDDPSPFAWRAAGPTLAPGESTLLELALDRSPLDEGTVTRTFTITTDGVGGGIVEVRARIERPPEVRIVGAPAAVTCPSSTPSFVVASVEDESPLSSVVLSWAGPRSAGSTPMRQGAGGWTGRVDDPRVDGSWSYSVAATDERGNVGTASGVFVVEGCDELTLVDG